MFLIGIFKFIHWYKIIFVNAWKRINKNQVFRRLNLSTSSTTTGTTAVHLTSLGEKQALAKKYDLCLSSQCALAK